MASAISEVPGSIPPPCGAATTQGEPVSRIKMTNEPAGSDDCNVQKLVYLSATGLMHYMEVTERPRRFMRDELGRAIGFLLRRSLHKLPSKKIQHGNACELTCQVPAVDCAGPTIKHKPESKVDRLFRS